MAGELAGIIHPPGCTNASGSGPSAGLGQILREMRERGERSDGRNAKNLWGIARRYTPDSRRCRHPPRPRQPGDAFRGTGAAKGEQVGR
jgi:hypothetical protein